MASDAMETEAVLTETTGTTTASDVMETETITVSDAMETETAIVLTETETALIKTVSTRTAEEMTGATAEEIRIMHTKCMGPDDMIANLSGGNQQKAIFGRWLERSPKIFMMDDPTRGIDVGAKYEIYELIIDMAKQGKTIIVVSSEMPEILGITNRIGVMSNGHLAGIVNTKETNQEELLRLSAKYL